jgi:hypothetical protein
MSRRRAGTTPQDVLHRVLHIFIPKRFSIPHNVLMPPRSFSNLRGAELFRNRQVSGSSPLGSIFFKYLQLVLTLQNGILSNAVPFTINVLYIIGIGWSRKGNRSAVSAVFGQSTRWPEIESCMVWNARYWGKGLATETPLL